MPAESVYREPEGKFFLQKMEKRLKKTALDSVFPDGNRVLFFTANLFLYRAEKHLTFCLLPA